ncbi:MAG: GPP34 family phosphoprotein [Bacteroidota bacterium]
MDLTIKEKLVLLAYHPDKGNCLVPTYIGHGLVGAILLELAGLEKIRVEDNRIKLMDSKKTGDEQLDYIIELLSHSTKSYKVKSIIAKLQAKSSKIKKPLIAGLVKKRYLKREEKQFLFIKYNRYPAYNRTYRSNLIEHIRRLVLRNIKLDDDITMLAGLTGATRLSIKFFRNREERKTARKRIKEIIKENQVDQAINETVQAVQAAVLASIATTAAISAAAASSH